MIRDVRLSDAAAICSIYNEYVKNTIITFEEEPVPVEEMKNRIKDVTQNYPWIVYVEPDNQNREKVIGYAYASRWKARSAYRKTVECTFYLEKSFTEKGIGSQLSVELVKRLKEKSIHSIIYGIALPNDASVALSEKFGFSKIGHFKEVGYKFNKWIDVGYWELIL
jgi:L-amino acid N-acyltransferase YncA